MSDNFIVQKSIDFRFYLKYEIYQFIALLNSLYINLCKYYKEDTSKSMKWFNFYRLTLHRYELTQCIHRIFKEKHFLLIYIDDPENNPLTRTISDELQKLTKRFFLLQTKYNRKIINYCQSTGCTLPEYNELASTFPELTLMNGSETEYEKLVLNDDTLYLLSPKREINS